MERWAIVEVMGRQSHVGRISEVHEFGGTFMRVEALQRDGTFMNHTLGAGAIYRYTEATEEEARRAFVARWSYSCGAFADSPVLPGACSTCGRTEAEHIATERQLPTASDADLDEEDPPPSSDDLPV